MRIGWRLAPAACALVLLCGVAPYAVRAEDAGGAGDAVGTVTGTVRDGSTGDPIIEAGVEIVGGGKRVRTDLDGKFAIKIAPGTYELRLFAPLYRGTRLTGVVVRGNQVTKTDATLAPEGKAGVEVVEVVAQADKAAEATQMLERKRSAVVSDNVAAETIKKSPDTTAAEVVKRAPAVTIQNNKFIYVRGLGERYSSALLNGSRLPSTDPDKRVVPLDLFPAEFVESLSIMKSYTPDLPGDFSGGLVDIRLKEFPEKLSYTIGLSTGGNTNATFQSFKTYKGSNLDYVGLGAEFRGLPHVIPDQLGTVSKAQGRVYSSAFHNIWSDESKTAPPNTGVNFSIGDSVGPLGAALGLAYTTEYKERRGEVAQSFTQAEMGREVVPFGNLTLNRSTFETRLGGVFTSAWKLTPSDKLTFRALVDRNSFDEVVDGIGANRNNLEQPITQSRLKYVEEQLGFGQLSGEHRWDWISLDWRSALSQTTQSEPDTRFVVYNLPNASNGITTRQFSSGSGPQSGERVFGDLEEYLSDSGIDLTVPFKTGLPLTTAWSGLPAKFKFGPAYSVRRRRFNYRRFTYTQISTGRPDLSQSPEMLLAPENIGVNFEFQDGSRPGDSFTATQEVAAFYGMFDLPLVADRLRLVAGVRTEYSYIDSQSFGSAQIINDVDPLPGLNLIFSPREDMNIRYGYSRSVSRPDFRELTPTDIPALEGELDEIGNPLLVSANIESHDLRWEWFLSPAEIVSFGVFYKDLTNPIENVIVGRSASNTVSFANASGGAKLYGFEAEVRRNLGALASTVERLRLGSPAWLNNLSLLANVAYVNSEVNLGSNPLVKLGPDLIVSTVQTNAKRALQGQAPYVVNAALEYEQPGLGIARVLYNTIGPRIVFAGTDKLPDIEEQPRHRLDLVLLSRINPFGTPLTAKLSAENLLDEPFEQTQGGNITRRYTTGVKFTFGLSYTY